MLMLALTACSQQGRPRGPRDLPLTADPSAVIAAELAFARLAQDKGQWTAFAETAAEDAVLFVPEAVNAKQWLRKQQNPTRAVAWQPHQVWSSCDGTLAVTKGAWRQPDGSVGYFTTIWQRQRDETYKWVLDQGDRLDTALAAPDFVKAEVADCTGPRGGAQAEKSSRDGTLRYQYRVEDNGSVRHLTVEMLVDGAMKTVLTSDVDLGLP
jgi:hypothetical protein